MPYYFQQYTLDETLPQLLRNGAPVDLHPRHVALLQLLLSEHQKPHWTHDELLQALWPGRVVTVQSVARLVADARKAFKAVGIEGRVIETLHGRGYRLAPVFLKSVGNEVVPKVDEAAETFSGPQTLMRRLMLILLPILLISGLALWLSLRPTPVLFSEAEAVTGRVLWVDDHPANNHEEVAALRDQGYGVHQVQNSQDALTLVAIYHFDLVISDMGRNDNPMAGLELLSALRAQGQNVPLVFYTLVVNPPLLEEVARREGQGAADSAPALAELVERYGRRAHSRLSR